jgi:hypothetical protein
MAPRIPFSEEQIRKGLPAPGSFGWRDLRCCHRPTAAHTTIVFLEMP